MTTLRVLTPTYGPFFKFFEKNGTFGKIPIRLVYGLYGWICRKTSLKTPKKRIFPCFGLQNGVFRDFRKNRKNGQISSLYIGSSNGHKMMIEV